MWNLRLISALVALSAFVGSVWYAYSSGKQSGMSQVQTLWDAERAVQLAAQAEAEMKSRQTEQAVQAAINRIRQEKHREAIKLANDYAAVVNSLHDREARPGGDGVSEGSGDGTEPARGCTGAELYRQDGEFLAREAHRADQLRIALQACRTAYDQVKEQFNAKQVP